MKLKLFIVPLIVIIGLIGISMMGACGGSDGAAKTVSVSMKAVKM